MESDRVIFMRGGDRESEVKKLVGLEGFKAGTAEGDVDRHGISHIMHKSHTRVGEEGDLRHIGSLMSEIDDHVAGSHDRIPLSYRISYGAVGISDYDTAVVLTRLIVNAVDISVDSSLV